MKTFVAVARREIIEKRFVLWAALLVGVMPFAVPIVRRLGGPSAREVRDVTAAIGTAGVAAAIAAGLGSSLFAGELAARRMSFFFSRPVSAFALWAGKLAAAAILVAATAALVLGPTALLDGAGFARRDTELGLAMLGAGLLLLFFFVNCLTTIVRSRSSLAFVDLVATALVVLAGTWAATRLRQHAFVDAAPLLWAGGGVVAAALILASYRAIARGRTSLRAAHAASSAALWSVLGPAVLLFAGYAVWALAAPVSALSKVHSASFLGSNGWVAVEGRARGLLASYLFDVRSGRFQRYESSSLVSDPADRVAAWFVPETARGPWTVHTFRLDNPEARERETKIAMRSRWVWPVFLSRDGVRLAAVEGKLMTVYDVETGAVLASFPVRESDEAIFGTFASPDVVRLLRVRLVSGTQLRRAEILEADVRSRTISVTGAANLEAWATVLASPYRDEILVNEGRGLRLAIRDPRTLAVRSVLREGQALRSSAARFLADGGVVLALDDEKQAWMEVFDADRVLARRIPLGAARRVRLAGETSNGRVLVGVTRSAAAPGEPAHAIEAVDLATGTVEHVANGLAPAVGWSGWEARRTPPGSEATRVFLSDDGKLVDLDPATRQRRILLGR